MARSGKLGYWDKVSAISTAVLAFVALITVLLVSLQTCNVQKQLNLSLSITSPYLNIRPKASNRLDEFILIIENVGTLPSRFIYRDQEIWTNRKVIKRSQPIKTVQNVIFPAKGVVSLTTKFAKEGIEGLKTGKICLEMAMCIIYGSTGSGDTRRWQSAAHYIFNPSKGRFDIREQVNMEVSESLQQCAVPRPIGCDRKL